MRGLGLMVEGEEGRKTEEAGGTKDNGWYERNWRSREKVERGPKVE